MDSSLLKLQQATGYVKHSLPLISENRVQGVSVMYDAANAL